MANRSGGSRGARRTLTLRSDYAPGVEAPPFMLSVQPEGQSRDVARPDETGRAADEPAVRVAPAGHGFAAHHRRGQTRLRCPTSYQATVRAHHFATGHGETAVRRVPARRGLDLPGASRHREGFALRRVPTRLAQHLPSQPAHSDARQQRLQRSVRVHVVRVLRPRRTHTAAGRRPHRQRPDPHDPRPLSRRRERLRAGRLWPRRERRRRDRLENAVDLARFAAVVPHLGLQLRRTARAT